MHDFEDANGWVRELARATTLPSGCYVNNDVFAAERESVFSRSWIPVAREEDLTRAGDFATMDVAGDPIVVTRGRDAEFHALANVCRHRNMTIVEGAGNVPSLRCPYHRWNYRLDGQLLTASAMNRTEAFDVHDVCLPRLATERWQGWVFVNLDAQAAPLAPQLSGLESICEPHDLGSMRRVAALDYHQDWNWKITVENFSESYHHAGVHSTTLQPVLPGERSWITTNRDEPWMTIDHISVDEAQEPLLVCVEFPIHMFAVVPPFGMAWFRMEVHDVHDVDLQIQLFVAPEFVSNDDLIELFVESTRAINDEDILVNRGVQRGTRSRFAQPGRISHLEEGCHRFRTWWLENLSWEMST